jgi:AcrR family transcriptional regulator
VTSQTAPPTTRQRASDRAAQIARVAETLFAERGFHAVRMEDIAAECGITVRALYRLYANKQALLAHVIIADQARLRAALDAVPASEDPELRLQGVIRALTHTSFIDLHLGQLWGREARHLDAESFEAVLRGTLGFHQTVRDAITQARPDLERYRADLRAWAIMSIVGSPGKHDLKMAVRTFTSLILELCASTVDAPETDAFSRDPIASAGGATRHDRSPSARREQLLAAAARNFRAKGYGGTSLDDFGVETGVVGPAIYRYFASKADVLTAVVTRYQEWEAIESLRSLRYANRDVDVIVRLVTGYIGVATEATDFLAVSMTESMHLPDQAGERVRRWESDQLLEWRRWLSTCRPALPEAAAQARVNATRSMIDELARVPSLVRDARFGDEVAACAMAVLSVDAPR